MYDNLTKDDIKKRQEEIEYRKLVVQQRSIGSSKRGKKPRAT